MYEKHNIKTYDDFENLFKLAAQKYPSLDISRIEMIEYFDDYIIDIETKDGIVSFKSDLLNGYDIGTFEIMDNSGTVCTLDYHDLCDVACMYRSSIGEERNLIKTFNYYYNLSLLSYKEDAPINKKMDKKDYQISLKYAVARASEDNNYEFAVDGQSATVYGNHSVYDIKLSNNYDIKHSIAGTYDGCPAQRRIWLQHLTDADINLQSILSNMLIKEGDTVITNPLFNECMKNDNKLKQYIREHICYYTAEEHNTMSNCTLLEKYCRDAVENVMKINLDELNKTNNEPDICDN